MCFKNEDQVVYENSNRLWYAILVSISTALDVTKVKLNIVALSKHLDCARCDKIRLRVRLIQIHW